MLVTQNYGNTKNCYCHKGNICTYDYPSFPGELISTLVGIYQGIEHCGHRVKRHGAINIDTYMSSG